MLNKTYCLHREAGTQQFVIYKKDTLKFDSIAKPILKYIIKPLRVKTGKGAQEIAKYFHAASMVWFLGGAAAIHSTSNTLFILFLALITQYGFHKNYILLKPLSELQTSELNETLLREAMQYTNARVFQYYGLIGVFIYSLATSSFWWLIWIVGIGSSNILRGVALTCGGSQNKIIKEKRPSIAFSMLRGLLPGTA